MDLPEGRSEEFLKLRELFCLRDWLQFWLPRVSSLVLRGEFLLDFECDGLGIHLVDLGRGSESLTAVCRRSGREQDDSFHDQLADSAFVGLTDKSG
jgi:hypothetical protein